MGFWKKGEDPWDVKREKDPWERRPARKREPPKEYGEPQESEEPKKGILERLDEGLEARRAKKKEEEEAKRLPPEPCPWCGKEMEQGYLITGRTYIEWYSGVYKTAWVTRDGEHFRVDTEGLWTTYRTTWLCRDCKKLVFDMPEPSEDVWAMDRYLYPKAEDEAKEDEAKEEEGVNNPQE